MGDFLIEDFLMGDFQLESSKSLSKPVMPLCNTESVLLVYDEQQFNSRFLMEAFLKLSDKQNLYNCSSSSPSLTELCTSIECHFGATCKVDANYKAPYCDCEQLQCDNSAALPANHPAALTSNRTQQLVCGSDDKTYTLCELKRAACWQQKRIEVQHYSACVNKKNADSGKISHHPNSKSASDKGGWRAKFNYLFIPSFLFFYPFPKSSDKSHVIHTQFIPDSYV